MLVTCRPLIADTFEKLFVYLLNPFCKAAAMPSPRVYPSKFPNNDTHKLLFIRLFQSPLYRNHLYEIMYCIFDSSLHNCTYRKFYRCINRDKSTFSNFGFLTIIHNFIQRLYINGWRLLWKAEGVDKCINDWG